MRERLLAALLVLLPAPALAQAAWPPALWNPSPIRDDLVLPLPCGGRMAFRPVETPMQDGALADRPVTVGQPDTGSDYAEFPRRAHVAGPFVAGGKRVFYLGKMEVTRDQYAAVMDAECPTPLEAGRVPRAEVSWFDAVAFTAKLSAWALANARDQLPKRGDAVAFVRLPTEEEWEYAARGGASLGEGEFAARTPPFSEGLAAHAWFAGPSSADGRARAAGSLKPGPLGLFDMLGNVAEWVLEPYRLSVVGRPHGQPGGAVARGGHFLTAEEQMRSSLREEYPPFNPRTGAPLALRMVGFRAALGLVVTVDDGAPDAFARAFEAEARGRQFTAENPAEILAALKRDTPDEAVRRGLTRVETALAGEQRARGEQAAAALKAQIEAASTLARVVAISRGNVAVLTALRGLLEGMAPMVPEASRGTVSGAATALERRVADTPAAVAQVLDAYLRAVREGGEAEAQAITAQARIVEAEMRSRSLPLGPELAALAARHMQASKAGRLPSPEVAEREILAAAGLSPAQRPPPAQRRP
ncbi:formylglycine-generating enzyme family protein [Elioraea rosea]|uniref:formylglycine-generating enzyme family protein n=1 Tax=Elioraea rosea TaxID=2492390 RepID=UPI001184D240|nr:SUMF1/EgtB/PvdO family nonheme iron enzyme [Elioraea rosea]